MPTPALLVYAGPLARAHLAERGLQPQDVALIPAAAGGPKGITLLPLDRYLFGQWLPHSAHTVHLLGASIGAWRMACAALPDVDEAIATLAEDYVSQRYPHAPGRMPTPQVASSHFAAKLRERIGQHAALILGNPRYRLHVLASRGRHMLRGAGPARAALGYAGAFTANAMHRKALGAWMQRVVFSDPRDALPLPMAHYPTAHVALTTQNLERAVLASCSIPFAMQAVQGVPGAPAGTYWDGGITDYHLHLNYAALQGGQAKLVLYPHFGPRLVPGWFDKAWPGRHRATPWLSNVVLLAPNPAWITSLPGGKLPDRTDFKRHLDDDAARESAWRKAYLESQRLADEFAALVQTGRPFQALPLV